MPDSFINSLAEACLSVRNQFVKTAISFTEKKQQTNEIFQTPDFFINSIAEAKKKYEKMKLLGIF